MQGKKQYAEKLFTNFQLSERVPKDNFYRKLKETLDLEFLYAETKKYYGNEGQQSLGLIHGGVVDVEDQRQREEEQGR